jgi:hypothetical protein
MATRAELPVLGATRSAMVSVSLAEVRIVAGGLVQTHRVCSARIDAGRSPARMEVPPRFVAALATHRYPVRVHADARGWRYRADLGVERIGYGPNGHDRLPVRPDDPAVYDWDGDGHPGATLVLVVPALVRGHLYVVQRGHSILDGRVVAPGRIAGTIEVPLLEQAVIGSRPAFLRRAPALVPDRTRSRFTLARVDAASCADLLAMP